MLRSEIAGEKYNKAERNRHLQQLLPSRSKGSIEFKHQNISAVMLGLGQPWIDGYKPASQFQSSLVDAVLEALPEVDNWQRNTGSSPKSSRHHPKAVREPAALFIRPPPTLSNEPSPIDPERMKVIASKIDIAARDERNRALGLDGEEFVFDFEKFRLRAEGRSDLANQVIWTSKEEGDGAGFDIASFEFDGSKRLLEVKTTNGWDRTPFHISQNELDVAEGNRDHWVLFRLHSFAKKPGAFELRPPLNRHVELTPTSFKASFQ